MSVPDHPTPAEMRIAASRLRTSIGLGPTWEQAFDRVQHFLREEADKLEDRQNGVDRYAGPQGQYW